MTCKILISNFLLVAVFQLSVSAQNSSNWVNKIIDNLPCSTFERAVWEGVSDKGSMHVPIKFGGKTHLFQLDTGADVTIIYGKPAKNLNWKEGQKTVRVKNIKIGGMNISEGKFYIEPNMKSGRVSGTVGLDLFMSNVAVIDFPGKRFCLMPNVDAPEEFRIKGQSVGAIIRNGKFFIEAKLNGKLTTDFFFDSGSSALPISVDFEEWKLLTGLSDESQSTKKVGGYSWGKPMFFVGAESKGELEIGSTKLGKQMIYYRSLPLDFFKRFPYQTIGNIGNAPFFDKVVVLDLGTHPAFRVLE